MTNIDKKELKILSLNFRQIAGRLINCHPDTGIPILKKFLAFIDENAIISEFIQDKIIPGEFEPPNPYDAVSSMGDTMEEEISETYKWLKYAAENFEDYYSQLAFNYAGNSKDSVKEFNNRFVLPFVNYIEDYLTEIGIKMGYDDEGKQFNITVNGGIAQVNVADANATIQNPVQNNAIDPVKIEEILVKVLNLLPQDSHDTDRKQVEENVKLIRREVQSSVPQKSVLSSAVNVLSGIKGTAEFLAAVATLYQILKPIIGG